MFLKKVENRIPILSGTNSEILSSAMVKIHNTLFSRLFIILLGVMLIFFGSYAYYTVKMQEEYLMAYKFSCEVR
ncbi:MAG: hypothetical protein KKF20_06685 [Bacteroidetes bacterium]|nr:hypothetical protein [Bacteroidota bacterium]MBU1423597.1 hypothetical protein [Bacteroidota bacterium]MBU2472077.1 hypothetical protein [Bacteroidota bacterium]MBU2635787.1 hypothetical protein [Bacteroidota bacterium]